MAWRDIGSADAIPVNANRTLAGVTVFHEPSGWHACETRCPHMGHPMAKGTIRDGVITCAWHKWEFDLAGGGCYRGGTDDLRTYPIRVEGGRILVERGDDAAAGAQAALKLREALLSGDLYLRAKAVARLAATGAEPDAIAAVVAQHGFRHSLAAHRDPQAAVELQAVLDAAELAAALPDEARVQALMLGVRAVGAGVTERAEVTALPPPRDATRLTARLADYVRDPSQLGLERILLTLHGLGVDAWPALVDLATRPWFAPHPEVARAVATALQARRVLGEAYARESAATAAWALGIGRGVPDAEEREAGDWIEEHRARLPTLGGAGPVAVDDVAALLTARSVGEALARATGWLERGAGRGALLDALSLVFARRLARLRPNNGGLWGSAAAGIDRCQALRRDLALDAPHGVQALLALVAHLHATRWLPDPQPWTEAAAGDWRGYERAVAAGDHDAARANAVAALAAESDRAGAAARWLGPLAREDLDADQLRALIAAHGEAATQREWQPYVAGVIGWALDAKQGRTVEAASRFGASFA